MDRVEHTVVLRSPEHYGRKVPPGPLGEFLHILPSVIRRSIRMAFSGASTSRGKYPQWLLSASDIRLVDYNGNGDTILCFEAPRLGDAAAELYSQAEFWPTKPNRDDTGFDILTDVIGEVAASNFESERFDPALLKELAKFQKPIAEAFQQIVITGRRHTMRNPCIIDASVIATTKKLRTATPLPRRVRIIGKLDMIRASTQAFALKLNDGEEAKGILLTGDIDKLAELFQREVMVLGTAIYRPSGRLLRIDANEIVPAPRDTKVFSTVPRPLRQKTDIRQIVREQKNKRGVTAIFGKWPSDETDSEIDRALRELS